MSDVKDYTSPADGSGNTHYNGVPSEFGRRVEQQNKMRPSYCEPGKADGKMHGSMRNEQKGP